MTEWPIALDDFAARYQVLTRLGLLIGDGAVVAACSVNFLEALAGAPAQTTAQIGEVAIAPLDPQDLGVP